MPCLRNSSHLYTINDFDFDSLPPTLRRKYFSSLERLRLAQDALSGRTPRDHRPFSHSRTQSSVRNVRHTTPYDPPSLGRSSTKRLRKTQSVAERQRASLEAAEWFAALPTKIQHTQFSREEQIGFAGKRNTVLFDAADEALFRLRQQTEVAKAGDSARAPLQSRFSLHLEPSHEQIPVDSAVDMDDSMFSGFHWLEEEKALDLTIQDHEPNLDDYHAAIANTTPTAASPPGKRQPSFRRNMSVASVQFREQPPLHSKTSHPSRSVSISSAPLSASLRPKSTLLGPMHKSHTSLSNIDPSAKHYQDPEARLKLRVYLASPQKFDEALEFGFPSLDKGQAKVSQLRPTTSPRSTEESERTFFRDETDSLFEDVNDDESITDSESPSTPHESLFEPVRDSKQDSTRYSDGPRPIALPRKLSEPHTQASGHRREMTLHMTLTRPDLRTTEAVEPTPATPHTSMLRPNVNWGSEPQSIWDTLPMEENRMKKLWRKFRRS